MSKTIPLTKGYVTVVDDEDYDMLMQWKWQARPTRSSGKYIRNKTDVYAARTGKDKGRSYPILLHRLIMGFPACQVDHKNGNTLDNQKTNLRLCTNSSNRANSAKMSGRSSSYKGVTWDKNRSKWKTAIKVNGKMINAGRFDDEILAAKTYDELALKYFGEFAKTNFK